MPERPSVLFMLSDQHSAMVLGHAEAAKLLIGKGADVNARDNMGRTPLHSTAGQSLIEALLGWLTDEPETEQDEGEAARNATRVEIARALLDRGADLNAQDNEGKTPPQLAIANHRAEPADFLRAHGANEQTSA
jgi:ankyrin repeat protein